MLEHIIKVLKFSAGERISIINQIRAVAVERGLADIVALADRSLEHERETCRYDSLWAERPVGRMYTLEVSVTDNTIDPVLTSIRDIAEAQIRNLPSGHSLIARVHDMLRDIFPAGVRALVSLPFVDQAAATEVVVERLQTVHASLVAELGLNARVAYLAELLNTYRQAIDTGRDLTFAEVNEMRARGHQLLCELLVFIAGRFYDASDPDQLEALTEFLQPVVRETELYRTRRARVRGGSEDLGEPETPEVLEPETPEVLEPGVDPAPVALSADEVSVVTVPVAG